MNLIVRLLFISLSFHVEQRQRARRFATAAYLQSPDSSRSLAGPANWRGLAGVEQEDPATDDGKAHQNWYLIRNRLLATQPHIGHGCGQTDQWHCEEKTDNQGRHAQE